MKVLTAALAVGAIMLPDLAHAGKLVTAPLTIYNGQANCLVAYHGALRNVSVNIQVFDPQGLVAGSGRFKMGPFNRVVSVPAECPDAAGGLSCSAACNVVFVVDRADMAVNFCSTQFSSDNPNAGETLCAEGR